MRVPRQAGNSQFRFYFNTIVNYDVTCKIVGDKRSELLFAWKYRRILAATA